MGKARPKFIRATGRAYTPKTTMEYEEKIRAAYLEKYGKEKPYGENIPLDVEIIAYFGIPKSDSMKVKEKKRSGEILPTIKSDIDNICKIIFDGVQGLAFGDDKQIVDVIAKKRYSDDPRVEVKINNHEEI